jgi:hypothetical protein
MSERLIDGDRAYFAWDAMVGGEGASVELDVVLETIDVPFWQPHRVRVMLPGCFGGRRSDECAQVFERVAQSLHSDYAVAGTLETAVFWPCEQSNQFGQPVLGWLTALGKKEHGPLSRLASLGRVSDCESQLLVSVGPPWDRNNARSLAAYRKLNEEFESLVGPPRSVIAGLEALEAESR